MIYNQFMPINSSDLTDFIKGQGWSDFGVVAVDELREVLKEHEPVFEAWLRQGYQADMGYLEAMKADRYHPENKVRDIQSVIVLQVWYSPDGGSNSGPPSGPQYGMVARYARGRDYHKILKKKLLALSGWIKAQQPEAETYFSADIGPTVDRALGEAAGLGFFGKNTNLIGPSKGSYFFIASLMTDQVIPPTEKRRMPSCGDCRKCISACPTGAIVAPGVIDARRCIAYLTIENKGGIPEELRPKIGNRLFGCDICQERCPFNEGRAGKQEIRMEGLKAENGAGDSLDLRELLTIETDEEYAERFAGTPLMRAKRRGLLRNACVVAGNSGDKSLVPLLQAVVEREEDEMLKEHANWALMQAEKATSGSG
jgi:epoxyqueuosine reductase